MTEVTYKTEFEDGTIFVEVTFDPKTGDISDSSVINWHGNEVTRLSEFYATKAVEEWMESDTEMVQS